jgi:hypothetical protein
MKIVKCCVNDKRIEVVAYDGGFTLLYIEGRKAPLNAKADWNVGHYKGAIMADMIASALIAKAPKCPRCGDVLDNGDCHQCGWFKD